VEKPLHHEENRRLQDRFDEQMELFRDALPRRKRGTREKSDATELPV
jgi:hypothetical protein